MRAKVLALRAKGLSYGKIARALGTTRSAVAGYICRHAKPVMPSPTQSVKRRAPDVPPEVITNLPELPIHETRYLMAVSLGYGIAATARAVGCGETVVRRSCRLVEDRRDDYDYDVWLSAIEEKNTPGY